MKIFLSILAGLALAWIAFGYFASRVKEPAYTIFAKKDGYEIREYGFYIEARVTVSGDYREAMSAGFRILAGYIFGGNTSKQEIAMTSPVMQQKGNEEASESISMTAPVLQRKLANNSRVVSFVMPEKYTLETLPVPNDSRIELVTIPAHRSAVVRYSGFNTQEKVAEHTSKLQANLERDGIVAEGEPRSAGYNPPTTPPFMKRNEIIIDILN